MEGKMLKKLLMILMIIMLTATDFLMLGTGLISYAESVDSATNNQNITFSTYFKNENGERIDSITENVNKEDLKVYAEIEVKEQGYFNGEITLGESNFKFKNTESSYINSMNENKIVLNQINAGNKVEIEIPVTINASETIKLDDLNKATKLELTGTYKLDKAKSKNIKGEKEVKLNLVADSENTKAELETEILTNKVYTINGSKKRIVQLSVKSNITNNNYPVKQTVLKINVPELSNKKPEEVKVLALSTMATNGLTENISADNWKNENGILQITVDNNENKEKEISWKKNETDSFIITFVYAENVDANKIEIKTTSEIEVYNLTDKLTAESTSLLEGKELNNIITTNIDIDNVETYKGQLYANTKSENKKEINFSTQTEIAVRNIATADTILVKEQKDVFTTENSDIAAKTKYLKTYINKDQMLKILGNEGYLIVKGENNVYYKLGQDSTTDEGGNIVITYNQEVSELEISTSKPVAEGIIKIQHEKTIMANDYDDKTIRTITGLKVQNTVTATLNGENVVENSTEKVKELKETSSQAELTVNKDNLSTITENKEVTVGVKLLTDNTKYDLYKNPKIRVQLPEAVEEITINSFDKLYADELEIEKAVYNKSNKTIEIDLKGEQTGYTDNSATQAYLQINMNMKLNKLAASKTDKITLTYSNENAIEQTSTIEKEIGIVAPNGLVTINNIENYNVEGISGTSSDKQLATVNKAEAGGTSADMKIALINNTKSAANNVKILGNFPTDGQFEIGNEKVKNNFTTKVKTAINAQNSTVYYSANETATADLSDANNGWTTNLKDIENPKTYLIETQDLKPEETFVATYSVELPKKLDYDLTAYSGYTVSYNEENNKAVQEADSTQVGLTTGEGIKVSTTLTATVGNNTLNNGDTVKAGEVIKYSVTAKNNGTTDLSSVIIKGGVPTGTAQVVPVDDYVYSGATYYKETDATEVTNTVSLAAGQEYTMSYEVRVKSDITAGQEIANKATVSCDNQGVESNELKAKSATGKLRVSVKRTVDLNEALVPNTGMSYYIIVENLSNDKLTNITMKLLTENLKIYSIDDMTDLYVSGKDNITIDEINANETKMYRFRGSTETGDITSIAMTVELTDSNGDKYRSNKDIQTVQKIGADIKLTSPQDGEYIKIGDEVEYDVTVKNTGDNETIKISGNMSEYLKIKAIYLNGKLEKQTTNSANTDTYMESIVSSFDYNLKISAGETATLKYVTEVIEPTDWFEVKTLSASAKVLVAGTEKGKTDEVTHIFRRNLDEEMKNIVSGMVWLDANKNGEKDSDESTLSGITVKLYDIEKAQIAKDRLGNQLLTQTDDKGEYTFSKVLDGKYLVLFDYEDDDYEPTSYKKEGVTESRNSNVIEGTVKIDGQDTACGVTDTLEVTSNITNVNLGLRQKQTYDMQLEKFVSRATVQTSSGTKTYDFNNTAFAKVEIGRKKIKGSTVIVEYTIRVKNAGDVAGYVTNIVDYLPNGLEFSSELNKDWYLSGDKLYSKSLATTRIEAGETKEIKLILTKAMTEDTVGLINNRAEIAEEYNEYGKTDINSTPNNQKNGENDLGSADIFIGVSTGGRTVAYTVLIMINTALIAFAVYLVFIKNRKRR